MQRGGPPSIHHPRGGVRSLGDLLATPEWQGSEVRYFEDLNRYYARVTHKSGAVARVTVSDAEYLNAPLSWKGKN